MRGLTLLGLATLLLAQGCVVLAVGAVAGAAAGITYTMWGIAEKTYGEEYEKVAVALQKTLASLDIKVGDTQKVEENQKVVTTEIEAFTRDLTIRITIERITDKATRVIVNASSKYFIKDKSLATEILIQTTNNLSKSS